LINTGEVASFIDDIIVETEEEERYDKVVRKVVKRLAKNNLCKTRKMQVKGQESRIFRSSDWS